MAIANILTQNSTIADRGWIPNKQKKDCYKTKQNDNQQWSTKVIKSTPFNPQVLHIKDNYISYWGQLSPYRGQLFWRWGQLSPYWGQLYQYWGQLSPHWGKIIGWICSPLSLFRLIWVLRNALRWWQSQCRLNLDRKYFDPIQFWTWAIFGSDTKCIARILSGPCHSL